MIYLAARYSRHPEMQGYAEALRQLGHVVTSRWIDGSHELKDVATDYDRSRLAEEDLDDLRASEVVISFTEEPRSANGQRGGRHVEFGLALALGKRMVLIGPRENIFHFLPAVAQFDTFDHMMRGVVEASGRSEGDG